MRPEPSSRHPLIVFLLLLSVFSGLTYLTTTRAPTSIEAQLGPVGVQLWAFGLFAGGLVSLAGLLLQGFPLKPRVFHYGVLCELVGMATLWAPAIIYTVAVLAAVGLTAIGPAGPIFAFGVACLYRMISLLIQMYRAGRVAMTEGAARDGAG